MRLLSLHKPLTRPVAALLSNLVLEMVIVIVPPLAPAAMAPPYKVDVPPRHMQQNLG